MSSAREPNSELKTHEKVESSWAAFHKKYEKLRLAERRDHKKPEAKPELKQDLKQNKPTTKLVLSFQELAWQELQKIRAKKLKKSDEKSPVPKPLDQKKPALSKDQASHIIGNFLNDRWRDLRKTGRPVKTRVGKKHKEIFKYFLHREPAKKSLNPVKLAELRKAILAADWSASIFKDPLLAQLTLALFADKQIVPWQAFTVL